MTNEPNKWIKKKIKEFRKGKCEICSAYSTKLQFAHLEKNGMNGPGRGRKERYYDFKRNRENYILVCSKTCNDSAEQLGKEGFKRFQKEKKDNENKY